MGGPSKKVASAGRRAARRTAPACSLPLDFSLQNEESVLSKPPHPPAPPSGPAVELARGAGPCPLGCSAESPHGHWGPGQVLRRADAHQQLRKRDLYLWNAVGSQSHPLPGQVTSQ